MSRRALVLGLALTAGASACDPCSGTPSCTSNPFIAATGQIVSQVTHSTIDGAIVSMVRRGGVATRFDSVATVSQLGGNWHVEMEAVEHGDVIVDVIVAAPGGQPYRVEGLRLPTLSGEGRSHVQPRWVPERYFPQIFELFYARSDTRVANVPVEFRRTGGAELFGTVPVDGIFRTVSNDAGWIRLFPPGVTAGSGGPVIGDLTLLLPTGPVTTRVELVPSHIYLQLHIFRLDVNGPTP